MRKVLIASAVALVLFSVGAFAATFFVNADDIASGTDEVAACADRVDVDWTVGAYDTTANDWNVTHAVLDFFDGNPGAVTQECNGFGAIIALEDGNGVKISETTVPATIANGTVTIDIPDVKAGPIRAASVLVDGEELTLTPPPPAP